MKGYIHARLRSADVPSVRNMQPSWLDAVSYNADIRGLCPRALRLAAKCEGLLLSLQLAAPLQSVCNRVSLAHATRVWAAAVPNTRCPDSAGRRLQSASEPKARGSAGRASPYGFIGCHRWTRLGVLGPSYSGRS